ncbi:helix-turn-helix domain-containing protein [Cellulosilyticum ruminicola]|uniref:helix-turn-helix domain-containing protein n=1 Tax=Cellulosilyticum ruminicola TaxID=425254 RepID=UPI0009FB4578
MNELADYLNVSRPSISRELRHMKDEGLIDIMWTKLKAGLVIGFLHIANPAFYITLFFTFLIIPHM